MVKKVETFETSDGKLFASETVAVTHEVMVELISRFPELKGVHTTIHKNAEIISEIFEPLVALRAKNHPDVSARPPSDHVVPLRRHRKGGVVPR